MNPGLYIGMLSGTSMDAVDCVLVSFGKGSPLVHDFRSFEIPLSTKKVLTHLIRNETIDLQLYGTADILTGKLFAASALSMMEKHNLAPEDIIAIGSHGQTIWHQPVADEHDSRFTIQIGDPNTIAHLTGVTTVADFRRHDMAAGGQGAPLAPAFHQAIFGNSSTPRVILNLGGIANITVLSAGSAPAFGYDTGPANTLLDQWIHHSLAREFDDNGSWAQSGKINNALLKLLRAERYFSLPHPKSTGRELFNLNWLLTRLAKMPGQVKPEDVQATLLELSALTIADRIKAHLSQGEILVCGGGIHNQALMQRLFALLPDFRIASTEHYGLNPDCVEAVAFAWFSKQTMLGAPIDFSPFTGASEPVIAGGIYKV
jgi:anhydro-N-acetylmuramic acid kinase